MAAEPRKGRRYRLFLVLIVAMLTHVALPSGAFAQRRGWSTWKRAEADESRLDVDELRAKVPDIDFEPVPPLAWIVPYGGFKLPFQPVGAGAWVALFPTPWLRVGLDYSVGISPTRESAAVSHYGEAFLGLRFASLDGTKAVDLVLESRVHEETVRAIVPSSHGFWIEGGALSGMLALSRCTDGCLEPGERTFVEHRRQLVIPAFGARYLYYFGYTSRERGLNSHDALQIFVQLLLPPLNASEERLFDRSGDPVHAPPLGARFGVSSPPLFGCLLEWTVGWGCLQGAFAVGYVPAEFPFLFEGRVEVPIVP